MNIDCLFAQDEERTPARTRHIKRTVAGMGEGENRGPSIATRTLSPGGQAHIIIIQCCTHEYTCTHAHKHTHAHMVCGQEKASAVEVRRRG